MALKSVEFFLKTAMLACTAHEYTWGVMRIEKFIVICSIIVSAFTVSVRVEAEVCHDAGNVLLPGVIEVYGGKYSIHAYGEEGRYTKRSVLLFLKQYAELEGYTTGTVKGTGGYGKPGTHIYNNDKADSSTGTDDVKAIVIRATQQAETMFARQRIMDMMDEEAMLPIHRYTVNKDGCTWKHEGGSYTIGAIMTLVAWKAVKDGKGKVNDGALQLGMALVTAIVYLYERFYYREREAYPSWWSHFSYPLIKQRKLNVSEQVRSIHSGMSVRKNEYDDVHHFFLSFTYILQTFCDYLKIRISNLNFPICSIPEHPFTVTIAQEAV